ncbi:MAG: patatin-like phospholipase family protein [Prevotellaceae bacterium]|jgi:NTE family protein|nr:patatin-like phospholipase family protein [Prevotellaceae bacterium]
MKKLTLLIIMSMFLFNTSAQKQKYKVGIVLSGGGALGFAHIGALQALEDCGIYPEIVAGASMGSIVGAFYANGYRPNEIYEFIKNEKFDHPINILAPTLKRGQLGLSSQKNVLKVLTKYIPHNTFEELKLPLFICVTNLTTGKAEFVNQGELIPYILASSAIPTVFEAVDINDMVYVDGGVLNNFPAQAIRKECTLLIGVDVKPDYEFTQANNIKDILMRSLQLVISENSQAGRQLCDVLIEPQSNVKYDEFSFKNFKKIYHDGYVSMKKYLDAHPEMWQKLAKQPEKTKTKKK